MAFERVIIDIETNSLIEPALDYTKRPYRLKNSVNLWCIVVRCIDTDEYKELTLGDCTRQNLKEILKDTELISGHNIINFDLPMLQLLGLLDYSVGYPGKPSLLYGKECKFFDTFLYSKLCNPDLTDTYGKHSLKSWGQRLGEFKIDFHNFDTYSREMVDYCIQDTKTNATLFHHITNLYVLKNWAIAFSMETKLADLTLRQSVFGFHFNKELAIKCLAELDQEMERIRAKVNPLLPPRKLTQGEKDYYSWPKNPFLKDGTLAKIAYKFATKVGGTLRGSTQEDAYLTYNGKDYKVADKQPLDVTMPSDIDNLDNLKAYLISLGWSPTEWKERDLLKKQDKSKKTEDEIIETIDRYVKQTFSGYFANERCDLLDVDFTPEALQTFLYQFVKKGKPIWVPTGPKIAVGLDKDICPGLKLLGKKAEFVGDVIKYLTYKHRRSSILGKDEDSNFTSEFEDDDDIEEDNPLYHSSIKFDAKKQKGFLTHIREDGRIGTPADTLGANTARYRHRIVCNIPRVSSIYGKEMRSLFGCGVGYWQLGFDFASLEARIQGHYCMPYKDGAEIAKLLLAVKPNDTHSVLSRKIGIPRDLAKSVFYACLYGAQPKKIAKMVRCSMERAVQIYEEFWDALPALKELKEKVEEHWNTMGKKAVLGLDGRILRTRSKHSLINIIFQAAGAIYVKWSIVKISEIMEERGLLGDPFVDDETAKKAFLMIVNHDEAQYAVHPSLLQVKLFKDDEEAKNNLKDNCSAIGHSAKGSYVGYETPITQCLQEGIKLMADRLKLRSEMALEWSTGLNWQQTH